MEGNHFLEDIIIKDLQSGRVKDVVTRFPPEPNGYLHLGHAKSIVINFGIAEKFHGKCNLRFDDTNPTKEDIEYVQAIKRDIQALGYQWAAEYYASDYFDQIYAYAVQLIQQGDAYVCDLTADQIRETRGTLTQIGQVSPYRNRSIEENLLLFEQMKLGKFVDGSKVLRAKIDMTSPNINMRDPVIYRILHATHHRTKDRWCIYPMYDFTHPISDALESITHSICTLEFEDHRPLYDWVIDKCKFKNPPHQYEFARLNLTNTIMSKRYLKKLVDEKVVNGWDDPRMPTLCGVRKRGYPEIALKDFCDRIGVSKANSEVDIAMLEHCVREYLNEHAERKMVVLDPVLVTITNVNKDETLSVPVNPKDENSKTVSLPFSNQIYIERSDFQIDPPPKYYRLKPDGYVRLRGAYILHCDSYETDAQGNVIQVKCSVVPNSKSGSDTSNVKVKGVIHWVDAKHNINITVHRYSYLLNDAAFAGQDFSERFNANSLQTIQNAKAEINLKNASVAEKFQMLRVGYFTVEENNKNGIVLGEIVSLKDSFHA